MFCGVWKETKETKGKEKKKVNKGKEKGPSKGSDQLAIQDLGRSAWVGNGTNCL